MALVLEDGKVRVVSEVREELDLDKLDLEIAKLSEEISRLEAVLLEKQALKAEAEDLLS